MKRVIMIVVIVLAICNLYVQDSASQEAAQFNMAESGLVLKGYDPVSYHQDQAQKGSEDFEASYNGLRYRFVSQANMDAFLATPQKYEPAYGGWCAWAMLKGDKVDINPQRFKIINGRTYLFYDGFFGNTLKKWNKKAEKMSEAELLHVADQHWLKERQ